MDAVERIRAEAADRGGEVADIRTEEASLESVFLDLAGGASDDRRTDREESEGQRATGPGA
jgi:ABC-2 type transport system ATP-binding protein